MLTFATRPFEKFDSVLRLLQNRIRTQVTSSSCDFGCQMRVSSMQGCVFVVSFRTLLHFFLYCVLFICNDVFLSTFIFQKP